MNFEYFISRRIAFSKEQSFSRLIVRIAITAIALSIAVMILANSMSTGFNKVITEKLFGFLGHMTINTIELTDNYEYEPMPAKPGFLNIIKENDEITRVYGFIEKYSLIKTRKGDEEFEGIRLNGFGDDYDWGFLKDYLKKGRLIDPGDSMSEKEIMITTFTAKRLQVDTGDKVYAYFIEQDKSRTRIRPLTIVGIFSTGMEEFDKKMAIVNIEMLRSVNGWTEEPLVGGLRVNIRHDSKLDDLQDELYGSTPMGYDVRSLKEMRRNIFDWLGLQKVNEWFVLVLMLIVAIINMITALLILILERTRMIGTLKSLGSTSLSLRKIFLYNAFQIISRGLIIGNLLGLGICYLQYQFGWLKLDEAAYYVSTAPVGFNWFWIIGLNIITLVVCLLALVLPSYLVARITPLKSLRFE